MITWVLANPVPPKHARLAVFTYTTRSDSRDSISTMQEIKIVERSIAGAQFAAKLGKTETT